VARDEAREREQRARARAAWPLRIRGLADPDADDLSTLTTAAERLAMMWPLALEAYRLAGLPIPTYDRASTPTRRVIGLPPDEE
jgi:hypothetical protein